ncbi:N-acylneuraminate cytidylyltransferase [Algibacter lectus]|uniref:acylneuraminate cytidylyltransferase family protein n=1 Tax=Algibacter lectus TaxID=221126 RepID=UPI0008F200D8|nr:acylneuraminate cytidylyltransferase family protein [Algibacter lectus]SFC64302.1 N-acylneuraminate cytidylyltransferase [Algibacter lectus]
MKPLVVIPARGGSKGVPRKNVKLLKGVPLINYTLKAALKVFAKEDICVSTDDDEIIKVVKQQGVDTPFKRPKVLSSDTATTQDVLLHAIEFYKKEYDTIVLLQPTSPFRDHIHIKEALDLYAKSGEIDMVVSVTITNSNPYYVLFEENKNGYLEKSKKGNFTRRQDVPNVYEYNGAIYVINIQSLLKNKMSEFNKVVKYLMNDESSHDIDTLLDWKIAELLMDLN